ncbi:MAG: hypothetical protein P8J87_13790, partial [Verrucomicrobiales bacterium]|nr:hypothetical protein [Verrucomicrobiales bacterium]
EVDASHPWIKYTVPYEKALFGVVTIDLAKGAMAIEGRQSSFVGPAPWELGRTKEEWDAETLTAGIGDRKIELGR